MTQILTCVKSGYVNGVASLPSKHKDSATWGNVILGGGVGYIIDRKSGAAFIYTRQVTVDLQKKNIIMGIAHSSLPIYGFQFLIRLVFYLFTYFHL